MTAVMTDTPRVAYSAATRVANMVGGTVVMMVGMMVAMTAPYLVDV